MIISAVEETVDVACSQSVGSAALQRLLVHKPELPINDMWVRHGGLTQNTAASWTEAARVCLDRHHAPPTIFSVRRSGQAEVNAIVQWNPTDDRTRGAWNNFNDTTEAGAYACVLAAVELVDGLVAVRRADTGTGADYYVAPVGTPTEDLEDWIRLEVSGVDSGDGKIVERRLRRKLDQAASGESNLPAMAGVTGFLARLILLAPLEAS